MSKILLEAITCVGLCGMGYKAKCLDAQQQRQQYKKIVSQIWLCTLVDGRRKMFSIIILYIHSHRRNILTGLCLLKD